MPEYALLPSSFSILKRISDRYIIILLIFVPGDSHCGKIMELLHPFTGPNGPIDSRRILFCQTWEGRVHMIRQLEVRVAIDSNPKVIEGIKSWVSEKVIFISETAKTEDKNIEVCEDLNASSFMATLMY